MSTSKSASNSNSPHWLFLVAGGLAIAITIGGTLASHSLANPEVDKARLTHLGGAVTDMPTTNIGDWQVDETITLAQPVEEVLECSGYLNRSYVHPETGDVLRVFVAVGPYHTISVHTPDVCYRGANYEQVGDPQVINVRVNGRSHGFWQLGMRSRSNPEEQLLVFYGYTDDGNNWSAPWDARFAFMGHPYLFKLQIALSTTQTTKKAAIANVENYLESLIPAMGNQLAAPH